MRSCQAPLPFLKIQWEVQSPPPQQSRKGGAHYENVLSHENYNNKRNLKSSNCLALLRPLPSQFVEFILIFILTLQLIMLFISMYLLGKVRFPLCCSVSQSTYCKGNQNPFLDVFLLCSILLWYCHSFFRNNNILKIMHSFSEFENCF